MSRRCHSCAGSSGVPCRTLEGARTPGVPRVLLPRVLLWTAGEGVERKRRSWASTAAVSEVSPRSYSLG